jgi:hypothetical protein
MQHPKRAPPATEQQPEFEYSLARWIQSQREPQDTCELWPGQVLHTCVAAAVLLPASVRGRIQNDMADMISHRPSTVGQMET